MKISDKYPRLQKEKALVIVTGKQDAVFYKIGDGVIEKIDAFKIPRPRYSDNEGFTKVRGRGVTLGAGWPRELRDEEIIKNFVRELKQRVKKIPSEFDKLYLFVPSQHKNEISKAIPRPYSDKLDRVLLGNFYYRSPQHLLDKLSEEHKL